jgi:hypothetical protein
LQGETGDHAGLRRAGDGTDDDRVEEHAEFPFLLRDLLRPAREAEAAERMVGCPGGNGVRLASRLLDRPQRLLPAPANPDVEAGRIEPHLGSHDPREQDVAHGLVAGFVPLDPVLLHEHALQTEPSRHGRHLPRVIRLDATDRHERVAALRERVGRQVLELANLVPAVRKAGVAVLALGPDVHAPAQVLAQPFEPVDG